LRGSESGWKLKLEKFRETERKREGEFGVGKIFKRCIDHETWGNLIGGQREEGKKGKRKQQTGETSKISIGGTEREKREEGLGALSESASLSTAMISIKQRRN